MLKEGVRLDRVRGGRQKYRRSTDPYVPGKTITLEGNERLATGVAGFFFSPLSFCLAIFDGLLFIIIYRSG